MKQTEKYYTCMCERDECDYLHYDSEQYNPLSHKQLYSRRRINTAAPAVVRYSLRYILLRTVIVIENIKSAVDCTYMKTKSIYLDWR